MKILPLEGVVSVAPKPVQIKPSAPKFSQVLELMQDKKGAAAVDLHQEIKMIEGKLLNGHSFSPQELLVYQIKVGRFGLNVELLSKCAESAVTTLRKLQTQ